jgi:AcrR family transcriptional regulator
MPRVIKHPEIRRAEILDLAFKMFIERGFDNTSLNEIISGGGLSKGMFYHHFASKDVLLEALFERITEQSYQILEPVISARDLNPKVRLQQILDRGAQIRMENVEFTREVFSSLLRPESKLLYERISEAWRNRMRPILGQIISEGVAKGVFKTNDPEGVGDLILLMQLSTTYILAQGMLAKTVRARDAAADALGERLKLHAVALGRVLKLPDDTFSIGPPDFAKKFMRALNPIGRGRSV